MSTAAAMAKAEAERAEQEEQEQPEPQSEPTPEPEPQPEPEPAEPQPEPLTPEQLEKRYKKAGQIAEKYAKQLTDALGPEIMATLVPSPLDALPGFVQVDPHGQVEPSVKAQTLAFLNVEAPPEYRQNSAMQTCKRCAGYGDLLTGSKRKGNELTGCPDCGGLGYTGPQGERIGAGPLGVVAPGPQANGTVEATPQTHGLGDPAVEALRAKGYTVLEPIHVG